MEANWCRSSCFAGGGGWFATYFTALYFWCPLIFVIHHSIDDWYKVNSFQQVDGVAPYFLPFFFYCPLIITISHSNDDSGSRSPLLLLNLFYCDNFSHKLGCLLSPGVYLRIILYSLLV